MAGADALLAFLGTPLPPRNAPIGTGMKRGPGMGLVPFERPLKMVGKHLLQLGKTPHQARVIPPGPPGAPLALAMATARQAGREEVAGSLVTP